MGKYLELFRGEVGDLTEKTKLENKPYVAYSTKEGRVVYTVVPAPVAEGPADNEIWYTTTDGSIITLQNTIGYDIVSHIYENGKGIITFNQSVTRLNENSFWNCYKMDSIVLPNSVTIIVGGTFPECRSLTSITIPNSVVEIGGWAFAMCDNLLVINFEGTVEQWNAIIKEDTWTEESSITTVQCTDGQVAI